MTTKNAVNNVTKSAQSKSTHQASAVTPSVQPMISSVNLQHAPSVPNGFTPLNRQEVNVLRKLRKDQRVNLMAVAAEIEASPTYVEDFGPYAPPQAEVVGLLRSSAALVAEAGNAKAWSKYMTNVMCVTEDATVAATGTMGSGLDYALQHNPALGTTYPLLLAFANTRSAAGKALAAKKKAAAAKAAKATAGSSSGVAATTATSAPAAVAVGSAGVTGK